MKKLTTILLILLSITGLADNNRKEKDKDKDKLGENFYYLNSRNHLVSPWRLMSLNGEVSLNGHYRERSWLYQESGLKNYSKALSGAIMFNSRSYVWHPNFLQVDAGFSYSPSNLQEDYLEVPGYSVEGTKKGVDFGATLFNSKPITLNAFANFGEDYQRRENLTDIKTKTNIRGATLLLSNKYFPLHATYSDRKWDQTELTSGRKFRDHKKSLQAKVVRSFFAQDRHVLSYFYEDNEHEFINNLQGYNDSKTMNINNRILLNSKVFLRSNKRSYFSSTHSYRDQKGRFSQRRFQANENVMFHLPNNWKSFNKYEYLNITQEAQTNRQHILRTNFSHKLYSSLKTNIFLEYKNINHSFYDEQEYRSGFSLAYIKKIPANGTLRLNYNYFRLHEDMKSEALILDFFNEKHTLSDINVELINKPYVDIGTIVVKDITGTIIYQLNFDYTLTQIGNFIEIRRLPGGLIADGSTIYVDYQATQPGTYDYDANNHSFFASVLLFKQFFELYYRRNQLDFENTEQIEFLSLDYFTENIVGARIKFMFAEAGVEYNDHKSNITPYQMKRYYIQLHHHYRNQILLSLHGNYRDHRLINAGIEQTYFDISSKIAYSFSPKKKLTIDFGYRKQIGKNTDIDLELLTARAEYTALIRQIYLTLGVEAYNRDYLKHEMNINGVYIRITRKFSK